MGCWEQRNWRHGTGPGSVELIDHYNPGTPILAMGVVLPKSMSSIAPPLWLRSFHNKGIHTERVLAIIDSGNEVGIGVRAGLNLFDQLIYLYI